MTQDLHFKEGQYNLILSIFFIPYVVSAPFLALAGKKFGPALVLCLMMMCFGSMTILVCAVHNFSGMRMISPLLFFTDDRIWNMLTPTLLQMSELVALRWFVGMSESAFFPLVIYYLTTFYRRLELGRRLSVC